MRRRSIAWCFWHQLIIMKLMYSEKLVSAAYFESSPLCGFDESSYVRFNESQVVSTYPSLGVCGSGFGSVLPQPSDISGIVDQCIQCTFVPVTGSGLCPQGFVAYLNGTWRLAAKDSCQRSGCMDSPCPADSYEDGEPALCPTGGLARNCCPIEEQIMCCARQQCTVREQSVGGCVAMEKDLLPGQRASVPKFVVPASSSGQCSLFIKWELQTCQADRTFLEQYFDTCTSLMMPQRDAQSCVKMPGYSLRPWPLPNGGMSEAVIDDNIPWYQLSNPAAALSAASVDMPLMAARCDRAGSSCIWFGSDDVNASLRSYLPVELEDGTTDSPPGSPYTCHGIYIKQQQQLPSSCPRLPGYLFKPSVTIAPLNSPICQNCWNSSKLAEDCSIASNCNGFSNKHGMLIDSIFPPPSSRTIFTRTACYGSFQRVGSGPNSGKMPSEIEAIDQLLCGTSTYCAVALEYEVSVSSDNASMDVLVTLPTAEAGGLQLPRTLSAPDSTTAQRLPSLIRVRSLRFICPGDGGAVITGGVPRPLFAIFPKLQQLVISGCGMSGQLPPEWSQMQELHVLDVSDNELYGSLPGEWSPMKLMHLNLSWNAFSGQVPDGWWGMIPSGTTADSQLLASTLPAWAGTPTIMSVADLGHNSLGGALPRAFAEGACLDHNVGLEFLPTGRSFRNSLKLLQADPQGGGGLPWWSFVSNAGLMQWAEPYSYALRRSSYAGDDRSINMCGSFQYIIALSIMWGSFMIAVIGVIVWCLWRKRNARLADKHAEARQQIQDNQSPDTASDENPGKVNAVQHQHDPQHDQQIDAVATTPSPSWYDKWWQQQRVRRGIFLFRFTWLVVDVALDVCLVIWLMANGSHTEATVCAVFIGLAQAAIALTSLVNLVPFVFSGIWQAVFLSPPLLAVMPLLAPLLAVWNAIDPDIPLVFWRYMELMEFSVMLLEAPAQSVTQSIIYARQNQVAKGMYLNHGLFVASIIFSLGDMLISIFKLLRYKNGPWRRIAIAITHLDTTRDALPYRTDIAYYSNFRSDTPTLWGGGAGVEGEEPLLEGHQGQRGTINNPLLTQLSQQNARDGVSQMQWGPLPRQPLLSKSMTGQTATTGMHLGVLQVQPNSQKGGILGMRSTSMTPSTAGPLMPTVDISGDETSPWRIRSKATNRRSSSASTVVRPLWSPETQPSSPALRSNRPFTESPPSSPSFRSNRPFTAGPSPLGQGSGSRTPEAGQTHGHDVDAPPSLADLMGTCDIHVSQSNPVFDGDIARSESRSGTGFKPEDSHARRSLSRHFSRNSSFGSLRGVAREDSFGPAMALALPPTSILYETPGSPKFSHKSEAVDSVIERLTIAGPRPDSPQMSPQLSPSSSPSNSRLASGGGSSSDYASQVLPMPPSRPLNGSGNLRRFTSSPRSQSPSTSTCFSRNIERDEEQQEQTYQEGTRVNFSSYRRGGQRPNWVSELDTISSKELSEGTGAPASIFTDSPTSVVSPFKSLSARISRTVSWAPMSPNNGGGASTSHGVSTTQFTVMPPESPPRQSPPGA